MEAVVFIIVILLGGGGSSSTTTHCHQGHAACGAGNTCCNNDKEVGERTMAGAGNSG